jgi:hypothetical protein
MEVEKIHFFLFSLDGGDGASSLRKHLSSLVSVSSVSAPSKQHLQYKITSSTANSNSGSTSSSSSVGMLAFAGGGYRASSLAIRGRAPFKQF